MLWLLIVCVLLSGCSPERDPATLLGAEAAGQLVVDAVLLVGQPLPPVYLRQTRPSGAAYTRTQAAVPDARIVLRQGATTYTYTAQPDSAGCYLPPGAAPTVAPLTPYELTVTWAGQQLTATTTTPATLKLTEVVVLDAVNLKELRQLRLFDATGGDPWAAPENELRYRQGLLEARLDQAPALAFQAAVVNLETDSEFLVDESFLEPGDQTDFDRQGSSPPTLLPDRRFRLPWFAVSFAGRHVLRVFSIDANWYAYIRTADLGGAFGGLVGDRFDRPRFNIEGGIGLFVSGSVDSVAFVVTRRTGP
jgi:hypothetical protein